MPRAPRTDSRTKPTRSRPTPRWLTKKTDLDAVARNRVLMVLSVLSGAKPVTAAIAEAGISRGFYYQLETKAINAMLLALAPGSDGDSSPDAMGLHHRIKELEAKVARAEQDKRRAERLLYVQQKLITGPVKTGRGRPPKRTSSTKAGRSGWRSSMIPTTRTPAMRSARKQTSEPTSATSSTPTPISDGTNADP